MPSPIRILLCHGYVHSRCHISGLNMCRWKGTRILEWVTFLEEGGRKCSWLIAALREKDEWGLCRDHLCFIGMNCSCFTALESVRGEHHCYICRFSIIKMFLAGVRNDHSHIFFSLPTLSDISKNKTTMCQALYLGKKVWADICSSFRA